jgi:hypothetical protein
MCNGVTCRWSMRCVRIRAESGDQASTGRLPAIPTLLSKYRLVPESGSTAYPYSGVPPLVSANSALSAVRRTHRSNPRRNTTQAPSGDNDSMGLRPGPARRQSKSGGRQLHRTSNASKAIPSSENSILRSGRSYGSTASLLAAANDRARRAWSNAGRRTPASGSTSTNSVPRSVSTRYQNLASSPIHIGLTRVRSASLGRLCPSIRSARSYAATARRSVTALPSRCGYWDSPGDRATAEPAAGSVP